LPAQPEAPDLASLRLRQLLDELDFARSLVPTGAALDDLDDLVSQARANRHPRPDDDIGVDDLTA
jgi:hypothetical protein